MRLIDSPEHIDFIVFSAHKMYAPFVIGVLIGKKEELIPELQVFDAKDYLKDALESNIQLFI